MISARVFPLVLCLCAAEFFITRKSPDGTTASHLDKDDDPNVVDLYRDLLKVQWPTVMSFVDKKDDPDANHVKSFLDCLEEGRVNCTLEAGQALAADASQKSHRASYEVRWVPDTLFQLAALFQFEENIMTKPQEQDDWFTETTVQIAPMFQFEEELGKKPDTRSMKKIPAKYAMTPFWSKFGLPNFTGAINKATSLQGFLDGAFKYSSHSFWDEILLLTLKYLEQMEKSSWVEVLDTILTDITEGRKKAPVEDGESRLSVLHKPLLQAIIDHEVEAAAKNNFTLNRGALGHFIQGHGNVFDLPSDSKSLSYATRMLDGLIHDFGESGACSLSYLCMVYGPQTIKPRNGYLLRLPMKEYLKGLRLRLQDHKDTTVTPFTVLFIPPISSIAGLFAHGENFHARSKARIVQDGFFKYTEECAQDLVKLDRDNGLSIFGEPNIDAAQFEIKLLSTIDAMEMIYRWDEKFERKFNMLKAQQKKLTTLAIGAQDKNE